MAGRVEAAHRAEPVAPDRERPFGGERRVELADRAGGRVARVGEGRLAGLGAALVQRFEVGDRQVDLAAHFDQLGRVLDAQRDRADRAQVAGHVLADPPVAAGRAAGQHAVLVGQGDRQAVDLRLGRVAELGAVDVEPLEVVAHPRLPGAQLLLVAGVGQREHLLGVLDLLEAVERRRADALGGRVGRAQLRVLGLDVAQLVEQRVVLVVADQRVVEDVVPVVVPRQLAPQLRRPLLVGRGAHTEEGATRRQHPLQRPGAQAVELAVVGEVEVDRRDRDPALRDRHQVGLLALLEARLPAVDLVVAPAVLVLGDQLQLVVVDAFAEPGHLDPARLAGGAVDVDQRLRRHRLVLQRGDELGEEGGGDGEVEAARDVAHAAARGLLGDRDGGDAEHDPLEGGGDRARVGDVVAEVGAVVDPGDDQVRALADQPELGEAHAVDRRAVGGEAAVAVAELDLLDAQRRARGDAARRRAAVRVRRDHLDLDPVDLAQRPPRGL